MGTLAKAFLYLGVYVLLHFAYEATGWEVLRPVAGVSESVFEHLKIGFFAYLFTSFGEFALLRRSPRRPREFWVSRILATWSVPWVILSCFYLVYTITEGPLPLTFELSFAFAVTFLSGIFGSILERGIEDIWFPPESKSVVFLLFFVALVFFVAFTYRVPPLDLFALPSSSHTVVGQ